MISRPRLHLPVQALVCVAAFGFGLPLAIALFPQTSEVRMSSLSNDLAPSKPRLIRHENGAFRKLSSNRRNLKTPALHFSLDRKHFENEAFRKRFFFQIPPV